MIIGLIYFISVKRKIINCIIAGALFIVFSFFGISNSFAFWETNLVYEGESIYNYLQVKENENSVILSTNVMFGVQSIMMKDGGLTGMYYDYALAAPYMAGVYEKAEGDILILGLGSGTYASQCIEYLENVNIEGVEIDKEIVDLSKRYFSLPESVSVSVNDARAYLAFSEKKYDVIMVECYFQEYFGYCCTDGDALGKLGLDIESEIYIRTGMSDVWPISDHLDDYNEAQLFTMLEFLYDNISEPTKKYYHEWNNCGYHATSFNKANGEKRFVEEVNSLLDGYHKDFNISIDGEVRISAISGIEKLIEAEIKTADVKDVDERIKYSISKFLHFDSSLNEKKEAIRTLGDVLEYYRKQDVKLEKKDDSALFQILNKFDLRHHNKEQLGDYDKDVWYEWMFYTYLASIRLLQKIYL